MDHRHRKEVAEKACADAHHRHQASLNRGIGSKLGTAPKQLSVIDQVDQALGSAHQLVYQIETLSDRLFGARPHNGEGTVDLPEGVLPNLERRAVQARTRLGEAMAAISAIEQALS